MQTHQTHMTSDQFAPMPNLQSFSSFDQPIKSGLHIEGRRWFQKSYGNTYHSVTIYQHGEVIAQLPRQYGYGDQFLQTAFAWLADNGFPCLAETYPNGCHKNQNTRFLREQLGSSYSVADVERQKDL
jgi:hypothetical protein